MANKKSYQMALLSSFIWLLCFFIAVAQSCYVTDCVSWSQKASKVLPVTTVTPPSRGDGGDTPKIAKLSAILTTKPERSSKRIITKQQQLLMALAYGSNATVPPISQIHSTLPVANYVRAEDPAPQSSPFYRIQQNSTRFQRPKSLLLHHLRRQAQLYTYFSRWKVENPVVRLIESDNS